MTILVGLLCEDGVVIGSDSSATFVSSGQQKTIEQPTKKVEVINGRAIIAGSGGVGLCQRFHAIVTQYWNDGRNKRKTPIEVGKELCTDSINDFKSTFVQKLDFGALLAFSSKGDFHLLEFEHGTFQPELKTKNLWYVSMGSGQPMCDPFLGLMRKVFWKNSPPRLNEGVFAVTWALQHAIDLNPGGIKGPLQNRYVIKARG